MCQKFIVSDYQSEILMCQNCNILQYLIHWISNTLKFQCQKFHYTGNSKMSAILIGQNSSTIDIEAYWKFNTLEFPVH